MKNDETEAFLREGMKRYADARDVVEAFEKEIQGRLCEALRRKWVNFAARPIVQGERGRGKAISSGVSSHGSGRIIWAELYAADDSNGWIDLGLWWASPAFPDRVVAYSSRWDPGNKQRPIALSDPGAPIQCGRIDRGKPCLYAVLEAGTDLSEIAALLLDEMDRALGEMNAAPGD